ncbi:MAG: RRXRR domain-containing protein [Nostoc sp.]|uniref:RRXRR domain-containing protein n=1 Tax=Nostoc sp. TaxID=1180 RepID=UPI002FF7E2AE
MRIPVVSSQNQPLMPTKPSRARKWIREGFAIGKFNDLGQFYVQLIDEPKPSQTQPVVIGIDPGKLYSGIGVQSSKVTLFTAHLVLPFQKVKDRMEQRAMMRRGRRGRRINRKVAFSLRSHRQKRFHNRRGSKLAPSIRANRQLELRVVSELGFVSGDTEKQISVSVANWKRLGQIAASKVQLIRRSTGLIVAS